MGITLQFYSAGVDQMFDAVFDVDFEVLEKAQIPGRFADLSLHLTPDDLNYLSRELCVAAGLEPVGLRDYLDTDGEFVNEPDRGAFQVHPDWVSFVSQVDDAAVPDLVNKWFEAMRVEYGDAEIQVSEEAIAGVLDLVRVCKESRRVGSSVVHVWFA
jgi:hypothetical protein